MIVCRERSRVHGPMRLKPQANQPIAYVSIEGRIHKTLLILPRNLFQTDFFAVFRQLDLNTGTPRFVYLYLNFSNDYNVHHRGGLRF